MPELLVALCITAMLLSFFLSCFFTVAEQQKERTAMLELQDNLMMAVEFLTEDISKSIAVVEWNTEMVKLRQQKHTTIQYTLGEDRQASEHFYELEGNILYRRENNQSNRQPMANFIDTLTFTCLDQNGQPALLAEDVCSVQVQITGIWNGKVLSREQIIRLAGTVYL